MTVSALALVPDPAPLVGLNEGWTEAPLVGLDELWEDAATFAEANRSENTRLAYASDWGDFTSWCQKVGTLPLPARPDMVAMYITDCAKKRHRGLGKRACRPPSRLSVSSIGRRLAAITYAHKNAGLDSPTRHPVVARVWGGIRRKLGVAPIAKTAIETGALSKLVEPLRYSPIDVRDRAILLIGFAGAFRRSELVGLNTGDVRFVDDGVTINLRKSKTDQEGAGALVGIAYGSKLTTCPVRALQRWIELAGSDDGELPLFRPVFSSGRIGTRRLIGQSIANLVKRHCEAVKLDPDCTHKKRDPDCKHAKLDPTKFGAHSLRSGFATSAARRGMPDRKIMRQTRHKSPASLNPYIQKATVFDDNASADVGL